MFWSNSRGDGSGVFSDGANWTGSVFTQPPDSSDIAHFGMTTSTLQPKTYTVTFTNSPTNQQAIVEDDRVTFDLNSHAYNLTNTFVGMALGTVSGRSGRLTVTDGFVILPLQSDLEIGSIAGGSGVLTVATGGLVGGSPEIFIGVNGAGTLNINNGGDVIADFVHVGTNTGSTGTATITGAGSSLNTAGLAVGGLSGLASGTLNVLSGGRIDGTLGRIGSSAGTATAAISGANSKWIVSGSMLVGVERSGNLSIADGGEVEDLNGSIGIDNGTGQLSTVEVTGANSKWTNQRDLYIGFGTLQITGGGTVENIAADATVIVGNGGPATVNIDGKNSKWVNASNLKVGQSPSDNIVNVTGGGFLQTADAILGDFNSTDRGTVVISGHSDDLTARSEWHASSIIVGQQGHGTLKVLAGARVEFGTTLGIGMGLGGTSEVFVDGPDSEIVVGGALRVGGLARGELNITGGARVVSPTAALASSGGQGLVVVSGAGSTWDIETDLDGVPGAGTVRIQPGGSVSVGDRITLNGGDALHLEGGVLTAGQIVVSGSTPAFFWTSGTLHLQVMFADLTVPSGGVLAPGVDFGDTTIPDGDFTLSSGGTLQIEIGGAQQAVTHDILNVIGGNVILAGGNLQIALRNGFTPAPTDAFTIVNLLGGHVTGSFANVAGGQRLATSDGLGSFIVSYSNESNVILSSFLPRHPGDFDLDGDVDGADLLVWQRGGSPRPNSSADLAEWRANFGFGGLTTAGTSVPEPHADSLAIALSLFAVLSRRRPV